MSKSSGQNSFFRFRLQYPTTSQKHNKMSVTREERLITTNHYRTFLVLRVKVPKYPIAFAATPLEPSSGLFTEFFAIFSILSKKSNTVVLTRKFPHKYI